MNKKKAMKKLINICYYLNVVGTVLFVLFILSIITGSVRFIDISTIESLATIILVRFVITMITLGSFILFIHNLLYWAKHKDRLIKLILLILFSIFYSPFYYKKYSSKNN
jgi:hypothetical protein